MAANGQRDDAAPQHAQARTNAAIPTAWALSPGFRRRGWRAHQADRVGARGGVSGPSLPLRWPAPMHRVIMVTMIRRTAPPSPSPPDGDTLTAGDVQLAWGMASQWKAHWRFQSAHRHGERPIGERLRAALELVHRQSDRESSPS
jgi:hypothetical protein